MNKKFVGQPRHPLDIRHQRAVAAKLDALLNGKMVDENGNPVGKILYADGNTIFQFTGGGTTLSAFILVSDGGDWYNCTSIGSSAMVKVGKEDSLCCLLPTAAPAGGAITARTERGTNYTYHYTAIGGSTTDGVNVVEYTREKVGAVTGPGPHNGFVEFVTPCLNVGDTIFAVAWKFTTPATLAGVTWLALPGKYEFSTVLEDLDSSAI